MKHYAISLVILMFAATSAVAQTAYVIDSDDTNHLWSVELSTGEANDIGAVNYAQIEGLATSPGGVLYGVDDATDTLVTINTGTGNATAVGSGNGNLGVDVSDVGLAFDSDGNLWLSAEVGNDFYSVNPSTGVATLINGAQAAPVTGLAACGTTIYGLVDGQDPQLVTIDPVTGDTSLVGSLGITIDDDGGLAMGADGTLWGVADGSPSTLFTINRTTGSATIVGDVSDGGSDLSGIEGFTTASPPAASCAVSLPAAIPALDMRGLLVLALLMAALGAWFVRFGGS